MQSKLNKFEQDAGKDKSRQSEINCWLYILPTYLSCTQGGEMAWDDQKKNSSENDYRYKRPMSIPLGICERFSNATYL